MAQLNDTMVQGDLRVTGSIYGNINGNAATATSAGKLTTARKTYVTLGTASTTTTRDWSGDTTIPVNGTLAISNGGTGATQVTGSSGALHNLTNDQIGTASQWFLTITNGWERCGYCSVADAKKVLGLGSAAYTESTAYAPSSTVSCTTANARSALGVNTGSGSTAKCLTEKGTWASFTNNAGTVTSVKVGSTSYSPSSGVVSLPAYPTTLPASDVSSWAKAASKPTYTASEVGAAPSSTVSCTTANVKSALGTGTGTAKYLREDGSWQIPPDTNTWRGIQNNLTSDSTTDSLSAAQGKKLNTNKLDKTTNLAGSGTIAETDIMAVNGSTDGFKMSYSATSSDLGKMKLHTIDDANAILSLGNTVSGSYKEAIKIVNGSATITGSLTGNCSGSSGSCTGNAATATKATKDADGNIIKATYMQTSSGNKSLSFGLSTIIGTVNGSDVKLVMPEANADTYEVNANSTSFADALAAFNANKKLLLTVGKSGGGSYTGVYYLPLYRLTFNGNTITQFVWMLDSDAYGDASGSNTYGAIYLYKLSESGWSTSSGNVDYALAAGTTYGGTADYVKMLHTNEVNFKNIPTSGNKSNFWFNYRNGDTDASDSANPLTDYYFGDRKSGTSTKLHADRLVGSADKWNGWSIVVGSTGTDANTLYFV